MRVPSLGMFADFSTRWVDTSTIVSAPTKMEYPSVHYISPLEIKQKYFFSRFETNNIIHEFIKINLPNRFIPAH